MQQREINVRYAFGQKVWCVAESLDGTLNVVSDFVKSVEVMKIDRYMAVFYRFVIYQGCEKELDVFSTEEEARKQIAKLLKKRKKQSND